MNIKEILFVILGIMFLPTIILTLLFLFKYLSKWRFKGDYSNYNFNSITGLKFRRSSKLPKDRCFFKKHLHINNGLFRTKLPRINLNDYDFEKVHMSGCIFTKDTILPDDINFFQKIKNKQLIDCVLPSGNYSNFNFDGVTINRVKFPKDAILPRNPNFFRGLDNKFVQVTLPASFKKECHLYDLSKTILWLPRKLKISDIQKTIIAMKNNGELYSFIESKKKKDSFLNNIISGLGN